MNSLVDELHVVTPPSGDWRERLEALLAPGTLFKRDEPLAKKTTLRVGGPADFYIEPASEAELARVLAFCQLEKVPWFILGRGSNLLILDGGIRGVVLSLAHERFRALELLGSQVRCGAGAKLKGVALHARQHGLSGLEFLEGIPGSVGGALRMNAGAMGGAIFQIVETVRVMDGSGQVRDYTPSDLMPRYRHCERLSGSIALSALLKGHPGNPEEIQATMDQFSRKRWDSQPAAPSAGCIFKNPVFIPAGRLIDELGLKGTRVGGAMISFEHGNFFVNTGNAKASDFLELIALAREQAMSRRSVPLETEVQIVGERAV